MPVQVIERDGVRYAEILRASEHVEHSTFFSPASSSLQFGLLAHGAGFVEAPHTHKTTSRTIDDLQQMFVVQRGAVAVEFYTDEGTKFAEVQLGVGDAILLVHGAHGLRVLEDMQCVSVKQGPFLGAAHDKIWLEVGE